MVHCTQPSAQRLASDTFSSIFLWRIYGEINCRLRDGFHAHFHEPTWYPIRALRDAEDATSSPEFATCVTYGRQTQATICINVEGRPGSCLCYHPECALLTQAQFLLGPIVFLSQTIRSVHVTYAYNSLTGASRSGDGGATHASSEDEGDSDASNNDAPSVGPPLPTMTELQALVSQFGSQVVHFGLQTRVWQVSKGLSCLTCAYV